MPNIFKTNLKLHRNIQREFLTVYLSMHKAPIDTLITVMGKHYSKSTTLEINNVPY